MGEPLNSHELTLVVCSSLRYHKPALPFREEYVYNNHLYVLAGYVAEVLESQRWEQLVTEYLLRPIGMTSTTFVREVLMTSPRQMAASCGWTEQGCAPVDIQLLEYETSVSFSVNYLYLHYISWLVSSRIYINVT